MLEALRRASQTWVAKALLIVLVGSFAVWGVSSSLVTGTANSVVTVGDVSVSPTDFRLAYERQVATMSQRFGMRLNAEQARAFGIENQVFAELVAGAALDQLSRDMNLGLSEGRLAQLIADDPAFRGVNGQFDRMAFSSVLRNAGLRENDYINNRSQVAIRAQVVEAVSDGYKAPDVLTAALRQYRSEARTIDYLILSNANIDPVKAPGDDVLAPWFEENKAKYRAPEYRKVVYVSLEPKDIVDTAAITDEALQADYEKNKDKYRTPATRTIEQLTFADRASADAAVAKLASGTTFDAIVAEQGKTAADVLLGDFTEANVPDQKFAAPAFAVAENGGTTPVIDGTFGPIILRVTNIRPENTKTFDEVKEDLRNELALSEAADGILAVHDRLEDARAEGLSLAEAAAKNNLKAVTIDAVDAQGNDQKGEEITGLPEKAALLGEVFKTDVGTETQPINVGREGYAWFEVLDVIPDRDRTLDEVRERVVADWTAEQQRQTLAKKAEELAERVRKGGDIATIAGELGMAVENKAGLNRGAQDPVLSPVAVAAAFAGPLGHVANTPGVDGEGQILLKVTEVNAETATDALSGDEQQIAAVARASGDDILDQMVSALQTSYGVSINRTLAEQSIAR
ncbi:SurA N-terminal domain-containing protein [Shinella sp. 838]|jgi:peptidyl-prolyl cis-trans isomerase D|uniref:peptidylprolyl isomerase n=2 Tax=Shinella TaxID=323620 RepID=UPI0003C53CD0|nr:MULTISPECIES: peptidylprolyl isomerase [unclassified Shinella]EYR79939.1 peptidyl-prolyl cis-trans isomerase D [Shinella sp. DD12]MCA0341365.1 SurA N-terminal domain-containing protein [Pseudomonadota bacterium]MDG4670935.1 SurA N-terminal domain-containing protein [Shinella sp. 838]